VYRPNPMKSGTKMLHLDILDKTTKKKMERTITKYVEDDDIVMIWCNEKGTLIHNIDYKMDYIMMYIFNIDR
jgi:ABC-type iron transport system FetAB ATPase subunit